MGVSENHALGRERVSVGRWNLACLGRETMDVTVAKIVANDQDDVGSLGGGCREDGGQEDEAEELSEGLLHGATSLRVRGATPSGLCDPGLP